MTTNAFTITKTTNNSLKIVNNGGSPEYYRNLRNLHIDTVGTLVRLSLDLGKTGVVSFEASQIATIGEVDGPFTADEAAAAIEDLGQF